MTLELVSRLLNHSGHEAGGNTQRTHDDVDDVTGMTTLWSISGSSCNANTTCRNKTRDNSMFQISRTQENFRTRTGLLRRLSNTAILLRSRRCPRGLLHLCLYLPADCHSGELCALRLLIFMWKTRSSQGRHPITHRQVGKIAKRHMAEIRQDQEVAEIRSKTLARELPRPSETMKDVVAAQRRCGLSQTQNERRD